MATTLNVLSATPSVQAGAGFAGFLCEVSNAQIAPADCLACARKGAPGCPMFPAAIERIAANIRPLEFAQGFAASAGAQFGISVTELLACPRKYRLMREYPYWEKPSAMMAAMEGTAVHAELARYTGPGLVEDRLTWVLKYTHPNGPTVTVALSGQPDLVEIRSGGIWITDYKRTSNPPRTTYSYVCRKHPDEEVAAARTRRGRSEYACPICGPLGRKDVSEVVAPPQARSGHAMQINLLAVLAEKNAAAISKALGVEPGVPIAGGEVIYLDGGTTLRCAIQPDRTAAIDLIKRRLAALLSPDLPEPLSEPDTLWECNYCALHDKCEELHGSPVGKQYFTQ